MSKDLRTQGISIGNTILSLGDLPNSTFPLALVLDQYGSISIDWRVFNAGDEDIVGNGEGGTSFTNSVYLSSDSNLDNLDVQLASFNVPGILANGTYQSFGSLGFSSTQFGAGQFLIFKTDATDLQSETDEENNLTVVAIDVPQALPDLSASSIDYLVGSGVINGGGGNDLIGSSSFNTLSVRPENSFAPGDVVKVAWTISNNGAATPFGWVDRLYISSSNVFDLGTARLIGEAAISDSAILNASGSYSYGYDSSGKPSYSVTLPTDLQTGELFLFVVSDAGEAIDEVNETNNAVATPIRIASPDLNPTSLLLSTGNGNFGGDSLAFSEISPNITTNVNNYVNVGWTVTNNGGSVSRFGWNDKFYLSDDQVFDSSDRLLSSINTANSSGLNGGDAYSYGLDVNNQPDSSYQVYIPGDISAGSRYLLLVTDADGVVSETDEANNTIAAPITITAPDLSVTAVTSPATASLNSPITVSWTVSNIGDSSAFGGWYDTVYISSDAVLDPGDRALYNRYNPNELGLAPNNGYSGGDQTFSIGNNISGGDQYLLFVTDSYRYINESIETNNVTARPITIAAPDLQVTSASISPSGVLGGQVSVNWTIANLGSASTASSYWYNNIVVSTDAIFGNSDDRIIANLYDGSHGVVGIGSSYSGSGYFNLPGDLAVGNYNVFLVADGYNYQAETIETNNVSQALPLTVNAPDLVVSTFTVPPIAASGDVITVGWTIANQGGANTLPSYLYNSVYISTDNVYGNSDDRVVATLYDYYGSISASGNHSGSAAVTLPAGLTAGNYNVFLVTDTYNYFGESNETNNASVATPIEIRNPNLTVASVNAPSVVTRGNQFGISWTVSNNSTSIAANSDWFDRVYLSTDNILDANDQQVFQEPVNSQTPLSSGSSYTVSRNITLGSGTADGNYFLIFQADGSSNQPETDESDNTATFQIEVKSADLQVSSVTPSATAVEFGQSFDITWNVANGGAGDLAANSNWTDGLFLSADNIAGNSDDIPIFARIRSQSLAAGGQYTDTASVVIDQNNPLPTDAQGYLSEAENNNSIATANDLQQNFTLTNGVSTYVVKAKGVVESPGAGDYYRFYASPGDTVTIDQDAYLSVGGVGAVGDSYLYLYDRNGSLIAADDDAGPGFSSYIRRTLPTTAYAGDYYIRAGGYSSNTGGYGLTVQLQTSVPLSVSRITPGNYYLVAKTDSKNGISETNENNNFAISSEQITLSSPLNRPDLSIVGTVPSTNLQIGSTVPITWTVSNISANSTASGWFDYVYLSNDNVLSNEDVVLASVARGTGEPPLAGGGSYTVERSVNLPTNVSGNQFLLFVTDRTNNRPELDETNNVNAVAINVTSPDLSVVIDSTPSTIDLSTPFNVSYTISNNGSLPTNAYWYDRIYLSNDGVISNDDLAFDFYESNQTPVATNSSQSRTRQITVNDVSRANVPQYIIVVTNNSGAQLEANKTNNSAVSTTTANVLVADLVVSQATAPSAGIVGDTVNVSWTVSNQGSGTAGADWYDYVYLSTDATYSYDDVYITNQLIGTQTPLVAGSSYSINRSIVLPNVVAGNYFLLFRADSDNYQSETSNSNNDRATAITVGTPDLLVTSFSAPASGALGTTVSLSWTVENQGLVAAVGDWNDAIYWSSDNVYDASDILLANVSAAAQSPVIAGGSYTKNVDVTLPNNLSTAGSGYLIVRTDANNIQGEVSNINNDRAVAFQTDAPDLVVTSASAPSSVSAIGETINVSWIVKNQGVAAANADWYDTIYLSNDMVLDSSDQYLGARWSGAETPLGVGNTYNASLSVTLPITTTGSRYLLVAADSGYYGYYSNNVQGETNETNNVYAIGIDVTAADLQVTAATAPASAVLGDTIEVSWTVANQGTGGAPTDWYDYVYLSNDQTLDGSDVALTSEYIAAQTPLATGGTYTITKNVLLPNFAIGDKYLIFAADRNNNQGEINETNNNRAVAISLSAPDLVATNVTVPTTGVLGQSIDVSWTVQNQGASMAPTDWYDQIYLSNDAFFDASDTYVGQELISSQTPLAAGSSYTATKSITLPNFNTGNRYVIVVADGNRNQGETNDTNNAQSAAIALQAPDLVVSSITAPVETLSGQPIDVVWTVTNQGATAAQGTWYDRLYLVNAATGAYVREIGSYEFNGSIAAGASLERTQTVNLPLDLVGSFKVVATADFYGNLPEGTQQESNNISTDDRAIQVRLAPVPNLQVESVTPPATAFSSQDTVVQWTVKNNGTGATSAPTWYDRVFLSLDNTYDNTDIYLGDAVNPSYLNVGDSYSNSLTVKLPRGISGDYHFLVQTDVYNQVAEVGNEGDNFGAGAATNVSLTPPPDLRVTAVSAPSQAFSGQQINLNWTVTNDGTGRTLETAWYDRVFMSADETLDASDQLLGDFYHVGALNAGDSYNRTAAVTLPVGVAGNFFFFVQSDIYNNVYEHVNENNNTGFDTPATTIQLTPPPDLEFESLTAPSTARSGTNLNISYQVTNFGATETPNPVWTDTFYLSSDNQFSASTDIALGSVTHYGVLNAGDSYNQTASFALSNTLTGRYYIFGVTDSGNTVFEIDNANNTFQAPGQVDISAQPADLVVTNTVSPATGNAGKSIQVQWTVKNQGVGDTITNAWNDSLILSADSTLGGADDIVLANFAHAGVLAANGTYSRTENINLPFVLNGNYHLFVVADTNGQVYESQNEGNNNSTGQPLLIGRQTADLQVASVGLPATAQSGAAVNLSWVVSNSGAARTNGDYWYDDVFLSADTTISNNDIKLGSVFHAGNLDVGATYNGSATFNLPIDLAGTYHVIVRTDGGGQIIEGASENNNDRASDGTLAVSLSAVPDLTVQSVDAVDQAIAGQPLSLTWTVANSGATTAGNWYDAVYLSRDRVFDRSSDIYLGYRNRTNGLSAGGSYTATEQFNVPRGLSGRFYAFVVADSGNQVYERGGEGNNTNFDPLSTEVIIPPPSDLVVTNITTPTSGIPGQSISIGYTIQNQGTDAAYGNWTDSVYLSKNTQWDIGDALLGEVRHFGDVAGGSSYSGTLTGILPGLNLGDYHVIVRSDIRNQVPELNESNNTGVSTTLVGVDVEVLSLGTPDSATLAQGQSVYYRFDATAGQAIRLKLDSADNTALNELYVRYGDMPTRGQFDFTTVQPFNADPEIIVPIEKTGTYYILGYGDSAGGAPNYTIKAEEIPFSITEVATKKIGNIGASTLEIRGAKFAANTVFQLRAADGKIIKATKALIENSTLAYATFDLFGENLGLYDVQAQQGNNTVALDDVITVENTKGFDLNSNITGPDEVRPNRTYRFDVNYANRGDIDTLAPLLVVESATNTKLGVAIDGLHSGAPIQLLGISRDGLPDVLRPGDLNTLPLYFNSDTDPVNFNVRTYSAENTTRLDWNQLQASIRPDNVSDTQWNKFLGNVAPQVKTYGQYVQLINDMSKELSTADKPIYDVRNLFGSMLSKNPDFHSTSSLGGNLLNAGDGNALVNAEVRAYQVTENGLKLAGITTTNNSGSFNFSALTAGQYQIVSGTPYVFDNNRDNVADTTDPTVTLDGKSNQNVGNLYATNPPPSAPIVQESAPTMTRDSDGNLNLVWTRQGQLWHAVNSGSGWSSAKPLTGAFGSDVKLLSGTTLIDGATPGLIATWRSGEGNASEIFYSIGRKNAAGEYEWATPNQLTNNNLYDGVYDVSIGSDGQPTFVWQRKNAAIEDDVDLYSTSIIIQNPRFTNSLNSFDSSSAWAESSGNGELQPASSITRYRYAQTLGKVTVPSWVPFLKGDYEAQFRADVTVQLDCTAIGAINGQFRLKVGDNGELAGEAGGQARWNTNKDTCSYEFKNARVNGSLTGGLNVPLTDWTLGPIGSIKIGPRIEASGGASAIWDAGSDFPSWPSRLQGNFRVSLGANIEGTVGIWGLGEAKVTGRVLGNANIVVNDQGLGFADPAFSVTVLARAEATVFGAKRFIDWTRTWPGTDLGGTSIETLDSTLATSTTPSYSEILTYGIIDGVNTGTLNDYSDSFATAFTNNLYDEGAPVLAVDGDGQLFRAWSSQTGIQVSSHSRTSSQWNAPVTITGTENLSNSDLAISFDTDGDGVAIWSSEDLSGVNSSSTQEQLRQSFENGGDLFFSVYDNTTGSWSSATSLFAMAGADRNISTGKDNNGNIIVAWQNQNSQYNSNLYSAIWNANTNGWTTPTILTSGSFVDKPSISSLGNSPIIMWTENQEAGANIVQSNQSIKYSLFNGTNWSSPLNFNYDLAVSGSGGIVSNTNSESLLTSGFSLPKPPEDCCECKPGDPKCDDDDDKDPDDDKYKPPVRRPRDPNDILGPKGFGEQQWVDVTDPFQYTIRFENAATASAPAQEVVITQQLDADLDWRTFRVDDYGWSGATYELVGDRAFHQTRIDLTSTKGFFVDVFATIDTATGLATWKISTIDPNTGEAPLDAQAGFLPTNDAQGAGEGFVSYSIKAKRTAQTGDIIDATAKIVFDTEEPIDTPAIFNTLDVTKPIALVNTLPTESETPEFAVSWAGTDQGSAIGSYSIYVADNGGQFTAWLTDTTLTESTYVGVAGHTYAFYAVATDNAGNIQVTPTQAQTSTRVAGGTGTIGNFIWEDLNADGVQDSGESGLNGVTVNLYNNDDQVVATTTTDSSGFYNFTNVATGNYSLGVVTPGTYLITTANVGTDDTVDSDLDVATGRTAVFAVNAGDNLTWDGGLYRLASINGQQWNDLDGNRLKGSNEPRLSGWTVYLDSNTNGQLDDGELSTVTDENGNYQFANLRPGNYTVAEVVKDGWRQTFPVLVTTSASDISLLTPNSPIVIENTVSAVAATSLINLDSFWADSRFANIKGQGYTTVIIDTGIDLDHSLFGPDQNGDGIGDRIIYQYDFADKDNNASDRNNHGSHVASIAAAIAPESNIIALKVFKDNNTGSFADLEKALQWVNKNAATYNIASVNLSLGDGKNWSTGTGRYGIGDELVAIASQNIIVNAAAGNGFYTYNSVEGLAYPAVDPNVISVGAVWADNFGPRSFSNGSKDYSTNADAIASFSQRSSLLDVFAPGVLITGANATGGTVTMGGTSQAAPFVSAIATLAQQVAQNYLGRKLTLAEFRNLLDTRSDLIIDGDNENDNVTNTGGTYNRINVLALADGILKLNSNGNGSTSGGSNNGGNNTSLDPTVTSNQVHTLTLVSGQVATDVDFGNKKLNQAPTGSPTAVLPSTAEDTSVVINPSNLLAGFSDADGDTLSVIDLTANNGVLTLNSNGTYTFAPNADFNGTVTLTYGVTDGTVILANQTLTFAVTPVNDAPVGSPTAVLTSIAEDTLVAIDPNDLLAGFGDVDGDTLSINGLTANNGVLTLNGNGTYTFAPNADFNGTITLTYGVTDGTVILANQTRTFAVTPVNDAPVGSPTAVLTSIAEDTSVVIDPNDLLTGFGDVDGDTLSINGLTANNGVLTLNGNGTYTFAPNADFNGTVTLTYGVTDGTVILPNQTRTFTVTAVNDAPVLQQAIANQTATQNKAFAFTIPSNSFQDVDAGDLLTYSATLSNGSPLPTWLTFNRTTRTFSGTPNQTSVGNISVKVTATDQSNAQASGVFTLAIGGVILGNAQANNLIGTNDDDQISGLAGNDTLDGGAGNDTLDGGTGNDTIFGGTGNDILIGGSGTDNLDGGEGSDIYEASATQADLDILNDTGTSGIDMLRNTGTTALTLNGFAPSNGIEVIEGNGQAIIGNINGNGLDFSTVSFTAVTYVDGGAGNDSIVGTAAGDDLRGGSGNDAIAGGDGADQLNGGSQNDTLLGGNDNDTLTGGSGDDSLDGGAGNNQLDGGTGNDTVLGGADSDRLIGSSGTDSLDGAGGSDIYEVSGTQGEFDILNDTGINGIDILRNTGAMALTLNGFAPSNGIEVIEGNNQAILGNTSGNSLDFSAVSFTDVAYVDGAAGNDSIVGTNAGDNLRGGAGDDSINGIDGADQLSGGDGNDTLLGGNGDDTLNGGNGNDRLDGGVGSDIYEASGSQAQFDLINDTGLTGVDTLKNTGTGALTLDSFSSTNGIEIIDGNNATLIGNGGNNVLDFSGVTLTNVLSVDGGSGNDQLVGTSFADNLRGGGGNDTLIGGAGNDTLAGGTGTDTFVLNSTADGIDQITDFTAASDRFNISRVGFGFSTTGVLATSAFRVGTAATTLDQRFIYDNTSGDLFFDADGSGVTAKVQIAQLGTKPTLASTSFVIV